MRIYIAGPYTHGDVAMNVRAAIEAADLLARFGHSPYVPHLTHFWHLVLPHDDINFWYELDLVWLRQCEGLLRLPGRSAGADREVEVARELGIPVFFETSDVPGVGCVVTLAPHGARTGDGGLKPPRGGSLDRE